MKKQRVQRNIKIEIKKTGAPYPAECWWRIVGANGRIFLHSETLGKKNAKKSIARIIDAIKRDKFTIVELPAGRSNKPAKEVAL